MQQQQKLRIASMHFPNIINQIRQLFPLINFMEKNENHIRQSAQIKPIISPLYHSSFRVSALQSRSVWARNCFPQTRSKGSKPTQEKSSATAEGK